MLRVGVRPIPTRYVSEALDNLCRQADNPQESPLPQLPRHGAEDARTTRILLRIDQDESVAVEADVTAVFPASRLPAAYDDTADHIAWFYFAPRHRFFDARDDDIPQTGVATARPTQDLDAHAFLCARVVGHIQVCVHLNHLPPSFPTPTQQATDK